MKNIAYLGLFIGIAGFSQTSLGTPHTWHIVSAAGGTETWKCQLADAYETNFYFVDKNLRNITEFEINPQSPFTFGFAFGDNVDFNLSYTLACTQQNGESMGSPKTVFVIGANGPADPDIKIVNFHGSFGNYTVVPGVGENYFVGLNHSKIE